ncbi:MAG: YlxR family protein [Bacilli bacterium]|nr:YlxR family protein [Bacilli bacterium]
MKLKKIPMRSCIITREKLPKNELVRVVRTPEGEVAIDLSGKMNGHGAYLKKDLEVIEKAKRGNALSHHLEIEIPEHVFEQLEKLVK